MNIGVILQARLSSRRLPGKVLHKIAGKPMLQYILERLEHCEYVETCVVATSTEERDLQIVNFCKEYGVNCYQGSLGDVAGRVKELLGIYHFDGFVRVNGDSPLLDQRLIDKGLKIFLKGNVEIVTNIFPRTYPKGQSVEIFRSDIFRNGYHLMEEKEDFEHVTKFFYKNRQHYKIKNFAFKEYLGEIQLSVDTTQDMERFSRIVAKMEKPHWQYNLQEILNIYREVVH